MTYKMFPKHVKLLCFLVTLPSFLGSTGTTRPHNDVNLRGHSFGLENFLFQSYEEELKPKRVRPAGNQRLADRGQTYNLENLTAYESSRINTIQKIKEPTAESSKITENIIHHTTEETGAVQDVTERIRKRVTMRRRRKRPQEGNADITGNAILNPIRKPIFPQVSKIVIRQKQPNQEIVYRLKPVEVKPTFLPDYTEEHVKFTDKTTIKTTTTTTTPKPSTINLKTFLKQQTETLSLSELLQTQNLSLADLLRGNKDASAILRAKQTITTPPSAKRKYTKGNVVTTEELPKKMEVVEITTARQNYNRFQPKIPRIKPSELKLTTEETLEVGQTKQQLFTSSEFDPQSKLNEMRLKLRNYQRKSTTTATLTEAATVIPAKLETIDPIIRVTEAPKKNKVYFKSTNNPELSVILPNKPKPESDFSKKTERPFRINRLPPFKRPDFSKNTESSSESPTITEERQDKVPTTNPPEEVENFEPKDEIIELLQSGQNANKLQKVLSSRNMTLQELLDNREKHPQMNIAELFASHEMTTSEPTLFDSFPNFGGELPGEYDEQEAEESAPSTARVKLIPNREAKQIPVVMKEEVELNLQPEDKSQAESSSLWKISDNAIYYGGSYGYSDFAMQTEKPKRTEEEESDIVLLEKIQENQNTNQKFKLDFSEYIREADEPLTEDIEKSYIPPAVKSAIIASGVVMGIALFVFIAIFAACGWKQRQIRLKGSLGDTLKKDKRALSPMSFKDRSYKKSLNFDSSSESGTSDTSSSLWNTLKNTFTSRTSTLKSRLEKEENLGEHKITLRRNESRRKESKADDRSITEERFQVKKIDRDRNVINTSFNFMRPSNNHFNECVHGY